MIGCSRSVTSVTTLPFRGHLLAELPSSFPHGLTVSWHYQTRKATRMAMVVDTRGTQLLQSEALCHLPVHRVEHTHTHSKIYPLGWEIYIGYWILRGSRAVRNVPFVKGLGSSTMKLRRLE